MDTLRVLTFNSHQPYLHLMATSLPWRFGIVTPHFPSGAIKNWDPHIRPLPDNATLYPSVQAAVRDGSWDWILTHNINDLLDVREVSLPKVFLVHGTLSGRILQDRSAIDKSLYIKKLGILLQASGARVVYISELKRRDWGIPGAILRPGVDVRQYGGYRGEIRGVLQVCNNLRARGAMMGWETYQAICRDLPNLVIGDNKDIASSRRAKDWEDLKEYLRSYRLYVYTPVYPYEDGYNLALLEAMATGMPVATLKHVSSPIRDGVEGVVADNAEQLRKKVAQLLDNPQEAMRLGLGARARVEQEFSLREFRNAWLDLAKDILQ
ncbi:MAG: glycosyltransferase [Acidobacteriota bacterium]|nr:glycosyltransferase [Acidobacteriota bacterium]